MKFTSLVEGLKKAVIMAERATGKNLTLPVLNNLLLEIKKGQLKISATDLEIGLDTYVSGKSEKEGDKEEGISVPAKTLSNFLSNLSEEKIVLESKDNVLSIKSGNFDATIQGLSSQDFPVIPEIKSDNFFELENMVLFNALSQIINSAGYTNGRPELNGILFDYNESELKLVSTDSFRLSEKTLKENQFKTNQKSNLRVVIPLKTAQEVLRISQDLKPEGNHMVKIIIDPNQICFHFGFLTLISRLIEDNFPKYENIVPKKFDTNIASSKKSLMDAIRIAGLFAGKSNDIKWQLYPNQKEIIIGSEDPSLGKGQSKVEVQITGAEMEIKFNYRYLLDGLNNIGFNQISIGLNTDSSPVLFRAAEDESYIYILMPLKIQ